MATLTTITLLLLFPLVSFYFEVAVAASAAGGVRLGGACTINTNCTVNVTNSECKNKTCQCLSTFFSQSNTCQTKKALGTACKGNVECSDANAICSNNCKCKTSHYKDSTNNCKPRIAPTNTCGNPKNTSCVANAFCNATKCACYKGFETTKTGCNAAVTMAIAEMSTILMCFMLAYFGVLK